MLTCVLFLVGYRMKCTAAKLGSPSLRRGRRPAAPLRESRDMPQMLTKFNKRPRKRLDLGLPMFFLVKRPSKGFQIASKGLLEASNMIFKGRLKAFRRLFAGFCGGFLEERLGLQRLQGCGAGLCRGDGSGPRGAQRPQEGAEHEVFGLRDLFHTRLIYRIVHDI